MFYYIYLLQSKTTRELYTGYTIDLKKRLVEHNRGLNKSTKSATPWELIYFEGCKNKEDATRREKYLKTSQGRRLLKGRVKEYFYNHKNKK